MSQLTFLLHFFGIFPFSSPSVRSVTNEKDGDESGDEHLGDLRQEIDRDNEYNERHLDQYLFRDDPSLSDIKTPLALSIHRQKGAGAFGGDVTSYVYRNSSGARLDIVFEDCAPQITGGTNV